MPVSLHLRITFHACNNVVTHITFAGHTAGIKFPRSRMSVRVRPHFLSISFSAAHVVTSRVGSVNAVITPRVLSESFNEITDAQSFCSPYSSSPKVLIVAVDLRYHFYIAEICAVHAKTAVGDAIFFDSLYVDIAAHIQRTSSHFVRLLDTSPFRSMYPHSLYFTLMMRWCWYSRRELLVLATLTFYWLSLVYGYHRSYWHYSFLAWLRDEIAPYFRCRPLHMTLLLFASCYLRFLYFRLLRHAQGGVPACSARAPMICWCWRARRTRRRLLVNGRNDSFWILLRRSLSSVSHATSIHVQSFLTFTWRCTLRGKLLIWREGH